MRRLAIALAGISLIGAQLAEHASAATPTSHCRGNSGGVPVRVTANTHTDCLYAKMTLDDLGYMYPRAMWRVGTHNYAVPRHGTNYHRGEDWHCRVYVRTMNGSEGHPVGRATGSCTYRYRASTRWTFDSGWFA